MPFLIIAAVFFSAFTFAEEVEEEKLNDILFFESFVDAYPSQQNLLYALGRSYYDIQAWSRAIKAFEKSLELKPDNEDAKLFLGYALLFKAKETPQTSESELKKSKELFEEILEETPGYTDAKEGLKAASKALAKEVEPVKEEKPIEKAKPVLPPMAPHHHEAKKKHHHHSADTLLALAKELSSQENYWGAVEVYTHLTERHPNNAEYFFFLGREYVRAGCRCLSKQAFLHSLELKEDYADSLIFMGRHYFFAENYCKAEYYFSKAIVANPKDVAGFVGLARVRAIFDDPCAAEELFEMAYELEPDNVDVLVPYYGFLSTEHKYASAEALYRTYAEENCDFEIFRVNIFETSAYTRPTFFARAGTAQEREKDLFSHRWVASLRYYNTEVGGIFPISDCLRVTPRIRAGTTRQRLLVSKRTQFDVKADGGGLKAEWIFDPDWTLIADLNMEWISNNHKPVVLPTKRGVKVEPSLIFRYFHYLDTVVFGETSDSIIFRDFKKNHVRVVTRDAAVFSYQRDFEDYRYFGFAAAWLWYQDRIHNQEQDAAIWFQAGFPYIEDLLSARYECAYRHFYHETTGYYSFQYQLTHWLKLRSNRHWLCGAHYEFEYWHGWRTTKGRNPQQQIVVSTVEQLAPVTTVEYQMDQVFLTVGYMPSDDLDIQLGGTYYHDSFDYTIMGAKIQIDWRF